MTAPWLVSSASWPARTADVPNTHCVLGVPAGWEADDAPAVVRGEESFGYRGPEPIEWLIVRYRPDNDATGELAGWVDGVLHAIGFPVIPPARLLISLPSLQDWSGGELDPAKLGVDELLGYHGLATWGTGDDARRMRLYVLLARRGHQAWHIALGIETATVPGMPAEDIDRGDHVRAGAVFGDLQLLDP